MAAGGERVNEQRFLAVCSFVLGLLERLLRDPDRTWLRSIRCELQEVDGWISLTRWTWGGLCFASVRIVVEFFRDPIWWFAGIVVGLVVAWIDHHAATREPLRALMVIGVALFVLLRTGHSLRWALALGIGTPLLAWIQRMRILSFQAGDGPYLHDTGDAMYVFLLTVPAAFVFGWIRNRWESRQSRGRLGNGGI